MRTATLTAVLFLLLTASADAQVSSLPVQVDVDDATFAYDAEHSLAEVYLAFEARRLPFERRAGMFVAELPMRIEVLRQSDAALESTPTNPVWEDQSSIAFSVEDTVGLGAGQYFVHQFRTLLQPGEYELRISIPEDSEAGRRALEIRRDLVVKDYASAGAEVSDITVASEIRPDAERSGPFYKSGFLIRPNPSRLYGGGLDHLYYYLETYGSETVGGADERYVVYAFVAEANRANPVKGLEQRTTRPARSPDVVVGSFDLSELPSGSYYLHAAVLNDANVSVAETSRKIFVYNPDVAREQPVFLEETFEMSEYVAMPEEQVEEGIAFAQIIANDQERRRFRTIEGLEDRRRTLMEFWKARDPDPATPQNEFRDEFRRRVSFVNDRYSSGRHEGWETDRGRVYVKYGAPAHMEPHLYDRDLLPHEIWQYNNIPGQGQAVFVFADRNSFGEFELIHSSVSGERSLPDWRSELGRR